MAFHKTVFDKLPVVIRSYAPVIGIMAWLTSKTTKQIWCFHPDTFPELQPVCMRPNDRFRVSVACAWYLYLTLLAAGAFSDFANLISPRYGTKHNPQTSTKRLYDLRIFCKAAFT